MRKRVKQTKPPESWRKEHKEKLAKLLEFDGQLIMVPPAAGGPADPLARIVACYPGTKEAFGDACSEVFTKLTSDIEAAGLECLAAVVDVVAGWPGKAKAAGRR